jgi:hypothetical protein
MFRRVVFPAVGALALLVALGAPGPAHAQHMRGAFPHRMPPTFRGNVMPGFRGGFDHRFSGRFFDPRFGRPFFDPRFGRFGRDFDRRFDARFRRFDRIEDRLEDRLFFGGFFPFFSPGF